MRKESNFLATNFLDFCEVNINLRTIGNKYIIGYNIVSEDLPFIFYETDSNLIYPLGKGIKSNYDLVLYLNNEDLYFIDNDDKEYRLVSDNYYSGMYILKEFGVKVLHVEEDDEETDYYLLYKGEETYRFELNEDKYYLVKITSNDGKEINITRNKDKITRLSKKVLTNGKEDELIQFNYATNVISLSYYKFGKFINSYSIRYLNNEIYKLSCFSDITTNPIYDYEIHRVQRSNGIEKSFTFKDNKLGLSKKIIFDNNDNIFKLIDVYNKIISIVREKYKTILTDFNNKSYTYVFEDDHRLNHVIDDYNCITSIILDSNDNGKVKSEFNIDLNHPASLGTIIPPNSKEISGENTLNTISILSPITKTNESGVKLLINNNEYEYKEIFIKSGLKEEVRSVLLYLLGNSNEISTKPVLEVKVKYYDSSSTLLDESDSYVINVLGTENKYYMFSTYSKFDYTKFEVVVKIINGYGNASLLIHTFNKSFGNTSCYDENGLKCITINKNKVSVIYYDLLGRTTYLNSSSYSYDDNIYTYVDNIDNKVVIEKDGSLLKSSKTYYKDSLVSSTLYGYLGGTNKVSYLEQDGNTFRYTYDTKYRVLETSYLNSVTRNSYNTGSDFYPMDRKSTTKYINNSIEGNNEIISSKNETLNILQTTIKNNSSVIVDTITDEYNRLSQIKFNNSLIYDVEYNENYPDFISRINEKNYQYYSNGLLRQINMLNEAPIYFYYDNLERLREVSSSSFIETYDYDKYGGLKAINNQINYSSIKYSYDKNYNLKGFATSVNGIGEIEEFSYIERKKQDLNKLYSLFMGNNKEIYSSFFIERIVNDVNKTFTLTSKYNNKEISEISENGFTLTEYNGLKVCKLSCNQMSYDLSNYSKEEGLLLFSDVTTTKFMIGGFLKVTNCPQFDNTRKTLVSLDTNYNGGYATESIVITDEGKLAFNSAATDYLDTSGLPNIDWTCWHLLNLIFDYDIGKIFVYVDGILRIENSFINQMSFTLECLNFGNKFNENGITVCLICPHFSSRDYFSPIEMRYIKKVFDEQIELYNVNQSERHYFYNELNNGNDLLVFNNNLISINNIHPLNEPFIDSTNMNLYFTFDNQKNMYVFKSFDTMKYQLESTDSGTISAKCKIVGTSGLIFKVIHNTMRFMLDFNGNQIRYYVDSNTIKGVYTLSNVSSYHDFTLTWNKVDNLIYEVKYYVDGILINNVITYSLSSIIDSGVILDIGSSNLMIQKVYMFNEALSQSNIMSKIININTYLLTKLVNERGLSTYETMYKNDSVLIDTLNTYNIKNQKTKVVKALKNYTLNFNYSYDSRNYLSFKSSFDDSYEYIYDNLGRLTDEITNGLVIHYTFDKVGNITSISSSKGNKNFSYDNYNRLIGGSFFNITYCNGTYDKFLFPAAIETNKQLLQFTWTNSKLTKINKIDYQGGNSTQINYSYDYRGLRTSKTYLLNGINYDYRYSYDNDGRLISEVRIINKTRLFFNYIYDSNGNLYGFTKNGVKYFYLRDETNEIRGIINSSGYLIGYYLYDAYGNILSIINIIQDSIMEENPFRYKGYYYDVETQLYWVSSRYYSPELCRWISPDSIEYLDPESINGLNLYAYCGNDPVNRFDPTGHDWEWSTFWTGLFMVGTAITAIALSVTTFGAGIPLAMSIVAGVTLGAGVLTGINGVATMIEAGTDYNFVRDGLFNDVLGLSDSAYNVYAGITEGVAAVGSMILGFYHTTGQYKAAKASQQYLGKGYTKAGKNRWVSADGYRQVRWDTTHHMYKGKPSPVHFNWYEYQYPIAPGVRNKLVSDVHVWLKWFSYYM